MADLRSMAAAGDRIERLLGEARAMASPPLWEQVEEIVRSVVGLHGEGLDRIVELLRAAPAGGELIARMATDELVASLLILHGLHPDDFSTRVRKALARVRPYLGSHGGDVEIVEVGAASGLVRLRMTGSCHGCPSSLLTVKLAVESAIREAAPDLTRVDVEGITESAAPPASAAAVEKVQLWVAIEDFDDPAPGALTTTSVGGSRLVLCRISGHLYAYRDACPACASPVSRGTLEGVLLRCLACRRLYNARGAGRSPDGHELHLEPVPLLEDHQGVKVALWAN